MVVRDAFGQQQVVTQPFYIAQQLLRPGLTEFSVGAGAGRLNYGLDQPRLRRHDRLRLGAPWHQRQSHRRGSRRGRCRRGRSRSWHRCSGGQPRRAERRRHGHSRPARQRHPISGGLRPPDSVPLVRRALHTGERELSRDWRLRAADCPVVDRLSCEPPSARYGSLAFGYTGQRYYDAEPLTIYSASYSINVGARAFLTLTGIEDPRSAESDPGAGAADDTDRQPDQRHRVGADDSPRRRDNAHRRGLRAAIPAGRRGLRLLRTREHRSPRRPAACSTPGPIGRYTLEAATDNGRSGLRASAAGGIAWVDDTMMFAQPIEQSFAVVKVGELDGVRVLQSNQDVGRTQAGRLALAQVPSLNGVTISVDPLSVPMDVALETTSPADRHAAAHRGCRRLRRDTPAQCAGAACAASGNSCAERSGRDDRGSSRPVPGRVRR